MNARTRDLTIAGGTVLVTLLLLLRGELVSGRLSPPRSESNAAGSVVAATGPVSPTPPAPDAGPVGPAARKMDTYAVDISWLRGFPPDAAPGDVFDIWVAWNRRVVKRANVQLLLEGVVLEKVAPPMTPHGPYVAILLMTRKQSSDFLYGREYGELSVTRPAG